MATPDINAANAADAANAAGKAAFSQRFAFRRKEAAADSAIVTFEGALVAAGRTRNILDEPGPWEFTATAIQQAIADGMFESLACFIDHANWLTGPSMRNLLGTWHNVVFDDELQAAVGELHIYRTADTQGMIDRLDAISADKEGGFAPPDVGVSIVCFPDYEDVEGVFRRITRFYAVESADVVFQPAVPTARLRFQQQGDLPIMDPEEIVEPVGSPAAVTNGTATPQAIHINNYIPTAPAALSFDTATDVTLEVNGQEIEDQLNGLADAFQARAAEADAWRAAFSKQVAAGMINAAALPQAAKNRLLKQTYGTPAEVEFAIENERAYAEEMADAYRAQFIATGPHPITSSDMTTEEDRVRDAVMWMFGVPGSQMPREMELRRLDWLWVAVTGDSNFNGVFDRTQQKFTMLTALTLPNLALDAMNKIIHARIADLENYRWYEELVAVDPNNGTLMDVKYIGYGGIGNLPTVADTAAYTELGLIDTKETASFVKKGGYVPLSRTIIKNSDLMRLQAVPKALATAAIRTRSAAVASLFTMNSGVGPTMSDGKALFHNDHSNLATTAFGTDDAAWNAARLEAFGHKELGTDAVLANMPRYALIPINLHTAALKVFGYGTGELSVREILTESRGAKDPRPQIVVVPEWTDTTDWGYLVDPALSPVLHMTYSTNPSGGSHPEPELFIANDPTSGLLFTNDVLPIKVRDEWAIGVSTWTGIGKRNVAG